MELPTPGWELTYFPTSTCLDYSTLCKNLIREVNFGLKMRKKGTRELVIFTYSMSKMLNLTQHLKDLILVLKIKEQCFRLISLKIRIAYLEK